MDEMVNQADVDKDGQARTDSDRQGRQGWTWTGKDSCGPSSAGGPAVAWAVICQGRKGAMDGKARWRD